MSGLLSKLASPFTDPMDMIGDQWNNVTGTTQSRAIQSGLQSQLQGAQQGVNAVQSGYGQGINTLQGMYGQAQGGFSPYLQGGQQDYGTLRSQMNSGAYSMPQFSFNPQNDHTLQFQMQQGTGAINNSAAARSGALGGNTLKSLMDYGQNLAGTYQQQAFERQLQGYGANQGEQQRQFGNQSQLAGYGQNAAQSLGSLGLGFGNSISSLYSGQGTTLADLYSGMGNSRAAAAIGGANAKAAGTQNLLNFGGKLIGGAGQIASMGG